ncbi:cytochrome c oxidase subunit II [Halobellus captivus]|uniref:cytochrome c oxidase subunit II n=1 Tax=Halobellus captivus TaxID=2592614 RepID=UPI0011A20778|nr:cytochrome c oxidase subunit II [Halobellus captivus]
MAIHAAGSVVPIPLQAELVPRGTRTVVFERIFEVFLALGTLVGVVVVAYMVYNAYKYRDGADREDDFDPPVLGELPTGGGGGRKLFTSFALSTVIVVSLISWTYLTLLYVEDPPEPEMEVEVEGYQFGWDFTYPNGHESDVLRVPRDEVIQLRVTSSDVFHNFGVAELRVKTDAVPGQTTTTWFEADETGNYTAQCYELCGSGHSYMTATVVVMEPDEYREWYANTTADSS